MRKKELVLLLTKIKNAQVYNKTYLVTFIFVIINVIFHNLIFSQEINNFELLNLLENRK